MNEWLNCGCFCPNIRTSNMVRSLFPTARVRDNSTNTYNIKKYFIL
jgi:hypothetical protein